MIFLDAAAFAASGFKPRVCVIGSGPAGITVANKLAASGVPVLILEAGSDEWTEESQDFYRGETVGDTYFDLDATRLRYLGGSSNHWAGWCRVLEAHDFEPKSWVADTGWPIRRADIEPWLDETRDVLGLHPFQPETALSERFARFEMQKSHPVLFGEKYRGAIEASDRIALLLNTAVTELVGDGKRVTAARIVSNGRSAGEVTAAFFVAATGGLENSRLLLWSNERSNGGVVPHAAALGRYWMEHPMFWTGNMLVTDMSAFALDEEGEAFFMPSPGAIADRQVLNFHVQIETMPYHGVKRMIADLACHAPETTEWLAWTLGSNLQCSARIHLDWEQAPRHHNRVALSRTLRDPLGIPRIELHWRKDELDRRTMLEAMRMFGEDVARRGIGRVQISDWVLNGEDYPDDMELAGNHHMGGTRMGDDPATSVVDRNGRVHGMENLYVGGSSVFTTSGQCTPTTTIVALSLRLGHHLAAEAMALKAARA